MFFGVNMKEIIVTYFEYTRNVGEQIALNLNVGGIWHGIVLGIVLCISCLLFMGCFYIPMFIFITIINKFEQYIKRKKAKLRKKVIKLGEKVGITNNLTKAYFYLLGILIFHPITFCKWLRK